jgi:hypothetical protein
MDARNAQNPDPIPDLPCTLNLEIGEGPTQTIEMELEEDIPAELEYFVRLTHFGLLKDAREWFNRCLEPYRGQFPVFLEYADMLWHEGSYKELQALQVDPLTAAESADPVELKFLCNLLKERARACLKGTLRTLRIALWTAKQCWFFLHNRYARKRVDTPGLPSAVEIHLIEVYLDIVVAARDAQVMDIENHFLNPPWSSSDVPPWRGFDAWYMDLRQHGRF